MLTELEMRILLVENTGRDLQKKMKSSPDTLLEEFLKNNMIERLLNS